MVNQLRLESLDELRTYVAIVDAGSLAGAAATLGVTPNAVSRRLGVLEQRLGRRLLDRTTRRMSVTDEGRRFHARCEQILGAAEEAEREVAGANGLTGTLRVSVHADMATPGVLLALGELLERSTALSVQLRVANRFVEPIRGGLDLAIHLGKPPPSSLVAFPLGFLVWTLAAAPAYTARRGLPRSPDQLIRHECLRVLRERPETSWALTRGGGATQRFEIGGRFETSDATALALALYGGLGIGLRLQPEIDAAVRAGTLVAVLPAWHSARMPVFAMVPQGRAKLPGVRALIDVLRAATRSLG